ncbi:aminomethyltransferase family protein [Mesorhizobium sp. M1329]|uniref:aminomethyltransferase family protein n=1 Tax=Mesorhizobium sp. M1329 TaxID=2957083 RepID=UPI0033359126
MSPMKTPVYSAFLDLGAHMIERLGFYVPQYFSDPKAEHLAVRQSAGLFEIFGQFFVDVSGSGSERFLQETMVADVGKLKDGRIVYCGILNDKGGMIDDVTCFRVDARRYWVVPAPSRRNVVAHYLADRSQQYEACVVSLGYKYTSLSLQGPHSRDLLSKLSDLDLSSSAFPTFTFKVGKIAETDDVVVSRTGFTGELGYELFVPSESADGVYRALVDRGAVPCGLGAMASLRLEKKYALYGLDLTEETTPVEAGLGWTIVAKESQYPGKAVVEKQKLEGPSRMLVQLELEGNSPPALGAQISADGRPVGKVTSAGMGHFVGRPLAMGYVEAPVATEGMSVVVDGGFVAKVRTTPIYDPKSQRLRG